MWLGRLVPVISTGTRRPSHLPKHRIGHASESQREHKRNVHPQEITIGDSSDSNCEQDSQTTDHQQFLTARVLRSKVAKDTAKDGCQSTT